MSGFRSGVIISAKKQGSGVVAVVEVSGDTEVDVPVGVPDGTLIPIAKLAGRPCMVFDIGNGDAGIGCMTFKWMAGDTSSEPVALKSDVDAVNARVSTLQGDFNALIVLYTAHVHGGVISGPPATVSGPPVVPGVASTATATTVGSNPLEVT